MLVTDCANFDPQFPETFPWGHLLSPKLSSAAFSIANRIEHELQNLPDDRLQTPGLREALRAIAETAEV